MSRSSARAAPLPHRPALPAAHPGAKPILSVENLSLAFGGTAAFAAIDLAVPPPDLRVDA